MLPSIFISLCLPSPCLVCLLNVPSLSAPLSAPLSVTPPLPLLSVPLSVLFGAVVSLHPTLKSKRWPCDFLKICATLTLFCALILPLFGICCPLVCTALPPKRPWIEPTTPQFTRFLVLWRHLGLPGVRSVCPGARSGVLGPRGSPSASLPCLGLLHLANFCLAWFKILGLFVVHRVVLTGPAPAGLTLRFRFGFSCQP